MDTGTIRGELVASVRLPLTEERWLLWGGLAGLFAYGIWVGATAAALTYGLDFAGQSLTVRPWTSTSTAAFGIGVVAWVLLPAAAVAYGVSRGVTNVRGNVARCYRFAHPSLLVLPPVVLVGVLAAVGVVRGTVSAPLAAALVVAAWFLLVRTLAYSYRVFSLSAPSLLKVSLFVATAVSAVALLGGVAVAAGRSALVEGAIAGVGGLVGSDLRWLLGTTTVGPVTLPALSALAAGVPAALSLLYLVAQALAAVVFRLWAPDVPRSNLKAGQRYPRFVRPAGARARASTGGRTAGGEEPAPGSETDDPGGEVPERGPGDTRLFTLEAAPSAGRAGQSRSGGPSGQETVVAEDTIPCPACGERIAGDADYTYCPACGTELAAPNP